ncbi:SGNH/GDSL hydrolase family protein [Mucilaginibacter roseus]|uniref:SGNH/GDSL hydrolase family protein n=1 Tax=Mucilaginibacter roseus TaxID=1528868 RepID=A0ABS8U7T6_9SPHI|nr:SGNH/GDSL hydrolase family protein [Mucilaginibacter roseus]MCD8741766.1 SGNH/GDSL hydrolase family protein [Mucilaginibacter roseus]
MPFIKSQHLRLLLIILSAYFFISCGKSSNHILPKTKIAVINKGVTGNQSGDVLKRLDPILKLNPDIAVLLIGTNDVTARRPVTEYTQNLQQIISAVQAHNIKLILMSPPPRGIDTSSLPEYYRNGHNDTLALINERLSIANNCYYLNLNKAFRDAGSPNATSGSLIFNRANNPSRPDGIHLTRSGVAFVAKTVYEFIQKTFPENSYDVVVCIGDSLTAGEEIGYPRTLSRLLNN